MENERENYFLKSDKDMYDMCFCCAKCVQNCARKNMPANQIITVSDLGTVCSSFKAEE